MILYWISGKLEAQMATNSAQNVQALARQLNRRQAVKRCIRHGILHNSPHRTPPNESICCSFIAPRRWHRWATWWIIRTWDQQQLGTWGFASFCLHISEFNLSQTYHFRIRTFDFWFEFQHFLDIDATLNEFQCLSMTMITNDSQWISSCCKAGGSELCRWVWKPLCLTGPSTRDLQTGPMAQNDNMKLPIQNVKRWRKTTRSQNDELKKRLCCKSVCAGDHKHWTQAREQNHFMFLSCTRLYRI